MLLGNVDHLGRGRESMIDTFCSHVVLEHHGCGRRPRKLVLTDLGDRGAKRKRLGFGIFLHSDRRVRHQLTCLDFGLRLFAWCSSGPIHMIVVILITSAILREMSHFEHPLVLRNVIGQMLSAILLNLLLEKSFFDRCTLVCLRANVVERDDGRLIELLADGGLGGCVALIIVDLDLLALNRDDVCEVDVGQICLVDPLDGAVLVPNFKVLHILELLDSHCAESFQIWRALDSFFGRSWPHLLWCLLVLNHQLRFGSFAICFFCGSFSKLALQGRLSIESSVFE